MDHLQDVNEDHQNIKFFFLIPLRRFQKFGFTGAYFNSEGDNVMVSLILCHL